MTNEEESKAMIKEMSRVVGDWAAELSPSTKESLSGYDLTALAACLVTGFDKAITNRTRATSSESPTIDPKLAGFEPSEYKA